MKKYDVIVVGAGNAGLSAAVTTSKAGLKTLILEKNSVPGGAATSFRRGRFEFECSLHELANVGTKEKPGSVRKLFEEYGVDINWQVENTAFRVIAKGENGFDITMPTGSESFCNELEKQVPGSYESAMALFELSKKADAAVEYMSKGKPDTMVLATEHADFLRIASHTVKECLDALGMPEKAQSIVCTYWPYLGASCEMLDLFHYLMMLDRYISYGAAMPKYRSHELSLGLEKAIRDSGGEIRYNTEVTEITVENGKATGVKVGNDFIGADYIIANCFPDTAYAKLIDKSQIPTRAFQLTNSRKPSTLFFTVYLGLNKSCDELGIKDYSVFMFDSTDPAKQFDSIKSTDTSFVIANCLNRAVPNASPDGTCTLFLTTLFSEEAWGEVTPENYKKTKNRIAERLISTYEKNTGVCIKPFIEEIVIATPATFARYLSTPNGTPYGYELSSTDSMIARIMNSKSEQFIENLSFTGAFGERGDGYNCTYAHGNSTAKQVLRKAGLL